MSKDDATHYYNILIEGLRPSAASAATATASSAGSSATTTPRDTFIDSPGTARSRHRDGATRENVALQLFNQKKTELNQMIADLRSKLAEAESERQALKAQTELVYGLLSEIKSLRAIINAPSNGDNPTDTSVTQEEVRNREKGRGSKKWKGGLAVACLLVITVITTALVIENVPRFEHLHFSIR